MTRDERGRFVPGVSGNPQGSSSKVKVTAQLLRSTLADTLTPDDAAAILRKLIDQAKRGDHRAREHLFAMLGVDLKTISLTQQGGVEITVRYERSGSTDAA